MPTAVLPLAVAPVKYQKSVSGFRFKVSGFFSSRLVRRPVL
jgi:hypothetical protein